MADEAGTVAPLKEEVDPNAPGCIEKFLVFLGLLLLGAMFVLASATNVEVDDGILVYALVLVARAVSGNLALAGLALGLLIPTWLSCCMTPRQRGQRRVWLRAIMSVLFLSLAVNFMYPYYACEEFAAGIDANLTKAFGGSFVTPPHPYRYEPLALWPYLMGMLSCVYEVSGSHGCSLVNPYQIKLLGAFDEFEMKAQLNFTDGSAYPTYLSMDAAGPIFEYITVPTPTGNGTTIAPTWAIPPPSRRKNRELHMLVARPRWANLTQKLPVIVGFHGFWGWGGFKQLEAFAPGIAGMVASGFVYCGIDFRMLAYGWDGRDQIHDGLTAIRWLMAHADDMGLADAYFLYGESGGGWPAYMTAHTGKKQGLPIYGAFVFYSWADPIWGIHHQHNNQKWGYDRLAFAETCGGGHGTNPREYVYPNLTNCGDLNMMTQFTDVPTLSLHGEYDEAYGPENVARLHEALDKANVTNMMVVIPKGHHAENVLAGTPYEQITTYVVERFLFTILEDPRFGLNMKIVSEELATIRDHTLDNLGITQEHLDNLGIDIQKKRIVDVSDNDVGIDIINATGPSVKSIDLSLGKGRRQ